MNTTTASYDELTKSVSSNLAALRADLPDVVKAFNDLARTATREGTLDKKTKELIALALGVSRRTVTRASASTPRRSSSWALREPRLKRPLAWRSTWAAAPH